MSRLRWPDSTNSVSEKPGTIHLAGLDTVRARVEPVNFAAAYQRSRLKRALRRLQYSMGGMDVRMGGDG